MKDLVSIVVANYNCDKYIGEFIESIIAQSYKNWELIIVDDGSTDNSQLLVEQYSSIDKRVIFISRTTDPKGANHCRNIGLERAKGKYICFFDSDDILPNYAIEVRVGEMKKNPTMDFIVFPAITFKKEPYDSRNFVIGTDGGYDNIAMFLRRYRLPFAVWTNIYRREFFKERAIEWDNELMSMQDSDLNLTILRGRVNYKFSSNRLPCYFWRKIESGNNITSAIKSVKNIDSQLYFFSKLKANFEKTKYAQDLSCFKLTLMHRTIFLNYPKLPIPLLYNQIDNVKYNFLRKLLPMLNIHNEKVSYSLFMMFFPIRFLKELYYRYKNNRQVKLYFKANMK